MTNTAEIIEISIEFEEEFDTTTMEDYKFNQIEIFSKTNAILSQLKEKFENLPTALNSKDDGYEFIKENQRKLQKLRKAITDEKDELTKDLKAEVKRITDEEKRIVAEIKEIEQPLIDAKKAIDDAEKRKKEERIARLQKKVDEIWEFVENAKGQSSDQIQIFLDCVENIDTTEDFYDLTKEATEMRAKTIAELSRMLSERMQFEMEEKARVEAQKAAEKAEAEKKEMEARAFVTEKINEIKMAPVDCIDSDFDEIQNKIEEIYEIVIDENVFLDRTEEATQAKISTIAKLEKLAKNAEILAEVEPEPEIEETPEEEIPQDCGHYAGLDRPKVEKEITPEIQETEEMVAGAYEQDLISISNYLIEIRSMEKPSMCTDEGDKILGEFVDKLRDFTASLEKTLSL